MRERDRRLNHGFTLIEIMISIAILALLVAFIARVMSSAMVIANIGGKRLDSDSQARAVFDRMAADFSSMIRRQDVDYIFAKQAGNDTMFFFSEATKYFDSSLSDSAKSSLALVGYRIDPSYQLERLSRGLTWDGQVGPSPAPGSIVFLTPSESATPVAGSTIAGNWANVVGTPGNGYTDGTGSDYHVIGDQVYRLEISFLQTNGNISTSVTPYNGLQNIAGIIVAIALLDPKSRTIVAPGGQIASPVGIPMVNALPDAVDGTSPLQTWKASSYLTTSGLPPTAASQLRIYERTFYLK
jgi:prepilin-type N-terminal cleavage/methylation domain-containing protein